ncbi:MAG: type II toxin-antitoxin system death-on-curing family toxin [Thermoplasmata archaeon]|nr:type II toxin-antitoxin system death-on-curing family toxin [Thermoplasmata archaeon]
MGKTRGRPSAFDQALEMAKMAWSPVLEILGDPELEALDKIPYDPEPFQFSVGEGLIRAELAQHHDTSDLQWLTVSQIIRIHDRMILTFGGELGILDEGKIASALDRARHSQVFGTDQFPTILHKAASIMHDILLYHPFADGQKRTGLSSAFIFLGLNGYALWSRDPADEVHFAIAVAKGEHEVEEISRWLADRVAPPSGLGESQLDLLVRTIRPAARQCHVCHRYLRLRGYLVRCKHCAASYKVLIRFGTVTTHRNGRRSVKATLGLIRERSPPAVTISLDRIGRSLLMRPVRGSGGWNSLLRALQSKLSPSGRMDLSPEDIDRIRGYSEHHGVGGFQSRLAPVLEAIRREGTRQRSDEGN